MSAFFESLDKEIAYEIRARCRAYSDLEANDKELDGIIKRLLTRLDLHETRKEFEDTGRKRYK